MRNGSMSWQSTPVCDTPPLRVYFAKLGYDLYAHVAEQVF